MQSTKPGNPILNLIKKTMIKRLATILTVIPAFCFAQWTQLGNGINGIQAGEFLGSTHSLAMDSSGNTIAVGTYRNNTLFPYSGYARVLNWNGSAWIQRGSNLTSTDSTHTATGYAVDLSANGMTVAVGSPYGYNSSGFRSGIVRVFDWSGSNWVQKGLSINGEGNANPIFSSDLFGSALQLNADGNRLVVGGPKNTTAIGVNQLCGHVRVFHWNGSAWNQIGQDIDAPLSFGTQEFGSAVSINDAGTRVAIGARAFTGSNSANQDMGLAMVLEYNGTSWVSLGDTLFGGGPSHKFGSAVQLSSNGNTIAVGAPGANSFQGLTKVFDWNGSQWIQRGADIAGLMSGQSGTSVGLSSNGNRIAIGDPFANSLKGATRIFAWNSNTWQQLGNTITLSGNAMDNFGSAVRLNDNGSKIVIGLPFNDQSANNAGQVRVFENALLQGSGESFNRLKLNVFPNPCMDFVQVRSDHEITSYELFNLSGQLIDSSEVNNHLTLEINMFGLKEGTYILRLNTIGGITNLKLVKL